MENKMKEKYYPEINIARGIVVLFVILGHSFPDAQAGISNSLAEFIHSYCYSFHMGLFFLLSGFVSTHRLLNKKTSFRTEIVKKLKRLAIPYFFYSFVTLSLKQIFSEYANNQFELSGVWKIMLGNNPNGGLWFLWTLFIIWLIAFGFGRLVNNEWVFIGIGSILYVLNLFINLSFMSSVCNFFIFYTIGMILNKYYSSMKKVMSAPLIVAVAAFLSVTIFPVLSMNGIGFNGLYLISAVIGSYAVLNISLYFTKHKGKLYKFLDESGNYSYDIYLLSYFVQVGIRVICWRILAFPYWITVVMMFVFGFVFPYYASKYIVIKFRLLRLLLVGRT